MHPLAQGVAVIQGALHKQQHRRRHYHSNALVIVGCSIRMNRCSWVLPWTQKCLRNTSKRARGRMCPYCISLDTLFLSRRTFWKTPLSMWTAHLRYRVANLILHCRIFPKDAARVVDKPSWVLWLLTECNKISFTPRRKWPLTCNRIYP